MENFKKFEKPTLNKNFDLGQERIEDVEKAQCMAIAENLSRTQAEAYKHYLFYPQSHLVPEKIVFSFWKDWHLSPDDIVENGKRTTEFMGNLYDAEKRIIEYERAHNLLGLTKETIFGGAQMTFNFLRYGFYAPRFLLSKEQKPTSLFGDKKMNEALSGSTEGTYKLLMAGEAMFRLGGFLESKPPRDIVNEFLEEYMAKTKMFSLKELHIEEKKSQIFNKATPKEDTVIAEAPVKRERPISEQINDRIFKWIIDKYGRFIKTGEKSYGWLDELFVEMNKKGVTTDDLKGEKEKVQDWMRSISEWKLKVSGFNEQEKKEEQTLSFLDLLVKIFSHPEPDNKSTDNVRDTISPLIKVFMLSRSK